MLEVRVLTPADHARWDAYVLGSPDSHFGQRIAWKTITERSYDVRPLYLLAEQDGAVRGVLPLFEKPGRTLFSAPGGLLADTPEIAERLLAPARERVQRQRLEYLELRDQRRAWPGLETSTEHVTMELALDSSPETQWKGFDAKLRNQVRKGEKAGFTLRWGRDQLADFHSVLLENMRDLGTPVRGAGYFGRALEGLGDSAELLVMRMGSARAGTMFVVRHRDGASDPWASSLRRYFTHCPNHVLYWAAIQRAIAGGLSRFDMGRSQWGSGTFLFKQQWGATPVPLYYQYVLGSAGAVPTLAGQKHGLDVAVRLWKHLPLPLAAMLGEPAKRMFPEVL